MKTLLQKLILLITLVLDCRAQHDPRLLKVAELDELRGTAFRQALIDLPKAERAELIAYLRAQPEANNPRSWTHGMLVALGEERARRDLLARLAEDGGFVINVIARTGDPEMIPPLIPHLFRNEPPDKIWTSDDTVAPPLSGDAYFAILRTAMRSPEFSPEVREWAKSWEIDFDAEGREMLRQWWRDNERFFLEKNYKAVQPGPKFVWVDPRSPAAAAAAGAAPAAAPQLAPSPPAAPGKVSQRPTASSRSESVTLLIAATAALCVLLGAVWMALRNCKRGR